MTSGQFHIVPLSSIWVDREKRQRRELTGIEELADSIRRTGLINPIVVKRDFELIAGERRFEAHKLLGADSIPIHYTDELDARALQLIELEENVRRTDLPWLDQCRAVQRYHQLQLDEDPNWTLDDTAKALGYKKSWISRLLVVMEEHDTGNALVINAPKLSTAVGVAQRAQERKRANVLSSITALTEPELAEKDAVVAATKRIIPLQHEDFHEWAAAYTGPRFNFLHCDFPYGVNAQDHDQGAGSSFGTYEDGAQVYWSLLETLRQSMSTVVADSAHLMFWFSMDYYTETKEVLSQMGWRVNPFPLVWLKSDNTGILPDPRRGPRRIYETAFFASRGDRPIVSAVSNAFAYPGSQKTIHMSEKPVPMLHHFMRMFVDENTRALDPTCGSGNALKAAGTLGAPTLLGLEKNREFFDLATEHYFDGEEDE